jgi:CBS domain-containing protein
MAPNPRSINQNATVRETAEILHEHGLHIAPVIDDAGRPIGVVSRTDLLDYWGRRRDRLAAIAAGKVNTAAAPAIVESPGDELTVREIMTPVVFGVRMNAPVGSIVEKMTALQIRCLFVTDSDGVLVGTVSVFDILPHLARRDAERGHTETPKSAVCTASLEKTFGLATAAPP